MGNWRAPVGTKSGSCLCGAIRFECRTVYDVVYCHCATCRHWSGAPVAISANVPTADFSVIKGTPQAYPSSQCGRRHFCQACGTHLYFTDDGPFVSVSVMALDDTDVRPRIHQCSASKLDWFEIADDLPRYADTRLPAPGGEQTTASAPAVNSHQASPDCVDAELFRTLEQALHRPEIRRSREAVSALLADGFMEFGRSGKVYDKAAVVDALATEGPVPNEGAPKVSDFAVQTLAPGVVLVTYRSGRRTPEGTELHALRSSIWKHAGGRWLMLFHQGTAISPSTQLSG